MRLIESIVLTLLRENRELRSENHRLKEDKEENEAMYERVIERLRNELAEKNQANNERR